MGFPKHLLRFDEHHIFLEAIVEKYNDADIHDITCVINKEIASDKNISSILNNLKLNCVVNNYTERGRTYSILTGLKAIPEDTHCFISNIDNPFIHADLLNEMKAALLPGSFVVPVHHGKGGHPVLLSSQVVQSLLTRNDILMSLKELLRDYKRITVEAKDDSILININTPDEYLRYFSAL